MSLFTKATKESAKLRLALQGAAGSGKTKSALSIAAGLGSRVALVDTERGSSRKYANEHQFDVVEVLDPAVQKALPKPGYHPDNAIFLLDMAAKDHDVVVIDSGSHFWNGTGGFLELVEDETKRMASAGKRADSFAAWKVVDPVYRRFVNAILNCPAHVIVCLRAKTEYEKKDGKVTKLGLSPEMRDNFQYEMDVEGMLNMEHDLVIGKTRCQTIDGRLFNKPGAEFAKILKDWLDDGAAPAAKPTAPQPVTIATDVLQNWLTNIAACATVAELDSLLETGIRKLPPDEQKSLVEPFRARKVQLQTGNAQ